jgi:hypothetical protein
MCGLLLASRPASAQEFCVKCEGPTATYRCVIERSLPSGGMPLKALCITALAREGGHASCRVGGGTVFECVGPIKRVSDPDAVNAAASLAPVPGTAVAPPQPGVAAPAQPSKPENQGPPRTVEEMARRMGQSSGDGMDKAGTAIEDAAKKSWGCLATFFKEC